MKAGGLVEDTALGYTMCMGIMKILFEGHNSALPVRRIAADENNTYNVVRPPHPQYVLCERITNFRFLITGIAAAALYVFIPCFAWAQESDSSQKPSQCLQNEAGSTVLEATRRPSKPLIDWDALLQGLYEDPYMYSSIGLIKNTDKSKLTYPNFGYNALFGFSKGSLGVYFGFDFFDLFKSGISIISMFTLGIPLKIFMFTVKPYAGIGVDFCTIIDAKDYSNYEIVSGRALSILGADCELGIQVMIHWFFISASYRQRLYPSKKIDYTLKNEYSDDTAIIIEELFFKRFVISIGFRG